jgi:hypothetical protein
MKNNKISANKGVSRAALLLIVALIVIGVIVVLGRSSGSPGNTGANASTTNVAVSETTKISGSLSEYKNSELGFSVKYPNFWEKEDTNAGVNFIIPIDKTQVSTIGTLQSTIQVLPRTCAFPPVTTVKDRGKITEGTNTFETISMSNQVQGRTYINRMYSLQKGDICYMFSFASIALSPQSKNLTGSNITQAENNNKAITATADADFTNMVKSFSFVSTPAGKDETQVSPQ